MTTPPLHIRLVTDDDLPAVIRIYQSAYQAPPYMSTWDDATAERIIREFRRLFPNQCWVAVRDGEIVGFILCSSIAGMRATVEEFCVAPRAQRQGVGDQLLAYALKHYHDEGFAFIELIANRNAPAWGFYRRRGFEENAEYKLMSRRL
ncbi:MAG: GNAT family N-acetyltransferase [Armatimonadia bacterium]